MKLTNLTEEEMLKAVFVSLKEMEEDDMMFALEDRGVGVYGNIDEDPLLVVVEERH
jgi:hypothetical protein